MLHERNPMKQKPLARFLTFQSDNGKSETCPELCRRIANPKLVVVLLSLRACAALADAQQTGKVFRIGFLDPSTASGSAVLLEAFRQELGKLGWIEGKNITIEYRFAEQKPERLPELAADLVRLKVDLIVVSAERSGVSGKEAQLLPFPS